MRAGWASRRSRWSVGFVVVVVAATAAAGDASGISGFLVAKFVGDMCEERSKRGEGEQTLLHLLFSLWFLLLLLLLLFELRLLPLRAFW
jgi:hypothetical protein